MTGSNNVLITGFGPFGEHKINASWEAVSALPDKIDGFNIIKQQIPVLYRYVQENVPLLWQQYDPKLVIHVGVSSCTNKIQLETCANRTGYGRTDIEDTCPENGQALCEMDSSNGCIKTGLCTQTICERLNQKQPHLKAAISNDSGRYLCEFLFYVSLNQNKNRTLFVHVPPMDQPFSKSQLVHALQDIITCALELVTKEELKYTCFPNDSARIFKNGRAAATF